MTAVTWKNDDLVRAMFQASASQGLIPQAEKLPDIPTIRDIHRLRTILPDFWLISDDDKKSKFYDLASRMLFNEQPIYKSAWHVVVGMRYGFVSLVQMIRRDGFHQAIQNAHALSAEMNIFLQEILLLWENDQEKLQKSVKDAILDAAQNPGRPFSSKEELKAILDDLF